MELEKNPKDLLKHQMESIETNFNKESITQMSRGQKKRLEKKIGQFASKKMIEEKGKKLHDEIEQIKKTKQKEEEKVKKNQKKLNEGFMETDDGPISRGIKNTNTFQKFDGMEQVLNQIGKQ